MQKTLLRIDASSRSSGSHSRALADAIEKRWREANPNGAVIVRDLMKSPVPHIGETAIRGFFSPEPALPPELRAATALSDALIDELMNSDALLVSTPMYNFSVPSALKAYIDQVTRVNKTFSFDGTEMHGLIKDKQTFVTMATGFVYENQPLANLDFARPYLRAWLKSIGIESVEFISIEGVNANQAALPQAKADALKRIERMAIGGREAV